MIVPYRPAGAPISGASRKSEFIRVRGKQKGGFWGARQQRLTFGWVGDVTELTNRDID